jgi:hypothetical protein
MAVLVVHVLVRQYALPRNIDGDRSLMAKLTPPTVTINPPEDGMFRFVM